MCSCSEAGSYLRLIDSCITQLIRLKDRLGPVTRVKKKSLTGDADRPIWLMGNASSLSESVAERESACLCVCVSECVRECVCACVSVCV